MGAGCSALSPTLTGKQNISKKQRSCPQIGCFLKVETISMCQWICMFEVYNGCTVHVQLHICESAWGPISAQGCV